MGSNKTISGVNDLQTVRPDIAALWDYEKNGELKPSQVAAFSERKVWWKCGLNHTWNSKVSDRARSSGCPFCEGKRILPGFNDLATLQPELAAQWDYEKNGDLNPSEFAPFSEKKVWWKCELNHSWTARIEDRSKDCGCPFCGGKRVLAGFNDLKTLRPELAAQWDYEKNGSLKPDMVTISAGTRIWWKCIMGHSWQAYVYSRTSGSGCPFCSGRNAVPGVNDLATLYPHIAAQWDTEKNGGLTPDKILPRSGKRAWWKCELNHSWCAIVRSRVHGCGCPFCSNTRVLPGFNDLAALRPDIARQWDCAKNGSLAPEDVTVYSNKKVWWICVQGHSWQTTVYSRSMGSGCPYCQGIKVMPGINDFASLYPEIAAQWDYEKNGERNPDQFLPHAGEKVWWKCGLNHSWSAEIANRTAGNGCPYCAGRKVWPGFNDMATVSPWLLDFWDYERNADLAPSDLMPHTNRKAWWKCQHGHHWRSSVVNMQKSSVCPYCYRGGTTRYRSRIVSSI